MFDHEKNSVLLGMDYYDIKDEIGAAVTIYTSKLDKFFDYQYGSLDTAI